MPLLLDAARDDRQRRILTLISSVQAMARPFVAPPGLPPARLEELRTAFDETMADSSFLEEARKLNLQVNPASGKDVQALVATLYATPPDIVAQAKKSIDEY